uniref:Uncharacterized protein n=1 Tax=Arundo donax TaxID=35708 RepID=A0A0A9FQ55_ARUDO
MKHKNSIPCGSPADEPLSRLANWEQSRGFAHNQRIISAVEEAMRSGVDGTKEHLFLPSVGQTFPSLSDAYQFYNLYSWEVGFSIRSERNQTGKDHINMQQWHCQRAEHMFLQ